MGNPLKRILVNREEIEQRVDELAGQLRTIYGDERLILISVLKGSVVFLSDLVRQLGPNTEFYFLQMSSYRGGTTPDGEPDLFALPHPDLKGQHVLLVEDILDTGQSLARAREHFSAFKPASLRICVLLAKEGYETSPVPDPDFVGFVIPREFVVGYGLDYQERYRGLPDIGIPADLAD
ncbi:MAG: hypoxanthine phosphoribosyltransferase [bacterium]